MPNFPFFNKLPESVKRILHENNLVIDKSRINSNLSEKKRENNVKENKLDTFSFEAIKGVEDAKAEYLKNGEPAALTNYQNEFLNFLEKFSGENFVEDTWVETAKYLLDKYNESTKIGEIVPKNLMKASTQEKRLYKLYFDTNNPLIGFGLLSEACNIALKANTNKAVVESEENRSLIKDLRARVKQVISNLIKSPTNSLSLETFKKLDRDLLDVEFRSNSSAPKLKPS